MRGPGLAVAARATALLTLALLASACAGTAPRREGGDCATWQGLAPVRVNPAGAPARHFRLQAAFRVCPAQEGMAEMERKRIELRHEVISLLSSQTETQLRDPLRAEKLRGQLITRANERVMRRARVVDVFITAMELE